MIPSRWSHQFSLYMICLYTLNWWLRLFRYLGHLRPTLTCPFTWNRIFHLPHISGFLKYVSLNTILNNQINCLIRTSSDHFVDYLLEDQNHRQNYLSIFVHDQARICWEFHLISYWLVHIDSARHTMRGQDLKSCPAWDPSVPTRWRMPSPTSRDMARRRPVPWRSGISGRIPGPKSGIARDTQVQ